MIFLFEKINLRCIETKVYTWSLMSGRPFNWISSLSVQSVGSIPRVACLGSECGRVYAAGKTLYDVKVIFYIKQYFAVAHVWFISCISDRIFWTISEEVTNIFHLIHERMVDWSAGRGYGVDGACYFLILSNNLLN